MVSAVDGHALGCPVRLVVTRVRALAVAETAVTGVLEAIDETCSRFRADSELSLLNAAPDRDVPVSPLLAAAMTAALRAARRSNGAVDPTVGGAVIAAGYDRDFTLVPSAGPLPDPPPTHPTKSAPLHRDFVGTPGTGGGSSYLTDWRSVRFDARRASVRIPHGVQIDLGATAKALAADLAAEAALGAAGGGVLVGLGGDIAMRGEPPEGGWRIQIGEDCREPVVASAEAICIGEGGIATSSTTVRRWRRGDALLHHLIDPRTGLPADGPWRTATAAAASCVDANTASTAAIVLGDEAPRWLAATGVPARLVARDGAIVRVGGWPER